MYTCTGPFLHHEWSEWEYNTTDMVDICIATIVVILVLLLKKMAEVGKLAIEL